ncbi:MAG TPA: DNA-directed RNA polymerase subunit beta' [Candidatus Paceibacterota bacterium]|nr:DNA-directed RNA polymerase subunit beta' [Candidatus Paceibacterota bacterium]
MRNQKFFSRYRTPRVETPNLVEAQLDSYKWILGEGIKETFKEFTPIKDYSGKKFDLEFVKLEIGEPKFDEHYAKAQKMTLDVPVRAIVKLKNKVAGTEKEQEIFLADMPLMTDHGTFVINGVERVIVPQLARSYGVFFTADEVKGKRHFGAKVIPARGAWIEVEAGSDNDLSVRIDRKRKFPVTSLLRVLGAPYDSDLKSLFSGNANEKRWIETALETDTAKTLEDSYIEIHKRLRDGDLATAANAREYIDSIFSEERYDLSRVGRYRFNQRFAKPLTETELTRKTLSLDDVVTVIKHVIELENNPEAMEDNIDHLGSRRVRYVGEMLQSRLRVGLTHMKRNIQDRMSTIDAEATMPVQFVNPRPLQARIKEFFTTNQLSQFMQQENALTELEHLRTLSALGPGGLTRERAGFEVRDVHPSHYGRLCPIHTPEGPNIGLILRLANFARLNEFGMIETPYAKVVNGKVTTEIKFLNAAEEETEHIAHAGTEVNADGQIKEDAVEVRLQGAPTRVPKNEVTYIDVAPEQPFSVATSMIPFLEHDDANRALMGSNMQKQATPCIVPEAPLVGTGIEARAAKDTGRLHLAKEDGVVTAADGKRVKVKNQKGKETEYPLVNFVRTNGFTALHQRPSVSVGDKVKKGDLLADTSTSDQGQLALGQNCLVAFMTWSGANYEDAIIISERMVKNSKFSSIHIEEFVCNVRDTKLGPEETTHDIPNVSENKLRNLDEDGIVRVGSEVRPGDILVGKITPKGETQLTPEERLLRSIFGDKARDVKDSSLRMENGKRGRIIGVKVFSREAGHNLESGIIKRIHVEIAQLRAVSVGDKLAGRHGNKGVISRILPEEDMPYMADGRPVDVILTPLGVPSRMNLGQILELHLGLAANTLDYQAICPPFAGATEEEIRAELKKAGFNESGKMPLYDGRTGEKFEADIAVGYMYILKLHHMVADKIHMRSIGPYSLITQQPLGGKAQGGGQRFGEMEVWALLGYGAAYTLREMLTIKSDDIVGRSAAFDAIVRGERINHHYAPASFNVLLHTLRGLSLDVELMRGGEAVKGVKKTPGAEVSDFDSVRIRPASPEKILEWSHGEVTKPETINYRTQRPEKNSLFDEKIFGPEKDYECYCGKYRGIRYKGIVCEKCGVEITRAIVRRERMGHVDLAVPVAHVWFLRAIPSRLSMVLGIPAGDLEKVVYFAGYIVNEIHKSEKERIVGELEAEYKMKMKNLQDEKSKDKMKELFLEAKRDIDSLEVGAVLDEPKYHRFAIKYGAMFEAGIGAEALYALCKSLNIKQMISDTETALEDAGAADREKFGKRLSALRAMSRAMVRPEWMFLTRIPVIPPGLRPMVALDGGRHATSDVNDLYRRVINRNNRLKKLLEIHAPDVILRNEKRILQEAVDALIDNSIRHGGAAYSATMQARQRPLKSLSDNLKGKHGLFRQNLLGKRVDYSGRSVIVVGPELKLNQCGLPKHMALELFRPFVIGKLLEKELAYNIRGAGRLIDEGVPEVWAILEDIIKDKYVLLNRAPTLHRLGIQAFQPVLIEGNAIQLHPLVCPAFNADFDGDQMAVHVPLSPEAQAEAREIMAAHRNILKPGNGEPVVATKLLDILLGVYWMTKEVEGMKGEGQAFQSPNAAILAYDYGAVGFQAKIKVLPSDKEKYAQYDGKLFETTVGRLLFNTVFPNDYAYINTPIDKKGMAKLVDNLIARYGLEKIPEIMDRIKNFGFRYVTQSGITWSLDDIKIPADKHRIVEVAQKKSDEIQRHWQDGLLSEEERYRLNLEVWHAAKADVEKLIPATLPINGPVSDMLKSGARGSLAQMTQMAGMKGLIASPTGETIELPVTKSMKEGLSPIEYFTTTHGSRSGLASTALSTAKAGYLTRRLFDVAQDVVIGEEDCGTKEGLTVKRESASGIGTFLAQNITGRYLAGDVEADGKTLFKKGHFITSVEAKQIEDAGIASVYTRSPIACKSAQGLCAKCYGADLGTMKPVALGEAVGTVAAQAIGEPGTQLTMNIKHAGGAASAGGDVTQGLPRVEEIFERRAPRNPAVVASVSGEVVEIRSDTKEKVLVVVPSIEHKGKGKKETVEYSMHPRRIPLVKVGDQVEKGQLLTDGSAELTELFKYAGKERAQEYIISEVLKIYELQGANISTKHLEVIVRQMFNRVKVVEGGSSEFSKGDITSEPDLIALNERLVAAGGEKATSEGLIMGILDVSLSRASFLSAASFQNTTRMLIRASLYGSVDHLEGLKENVIIGRLIPAGTGFKGSPKAAMVAKYGPQPTEMPVAKEEKEVVE